MNKGSGYWRLMSGICVMSVMLGGCSRERSSRASDKSAQVPRTTGPSADAAKPADIRSGGPAQSKAAATGSARAHPFVPVRDPGSRRMSTGPRNVQLELKGILEGETRAAIIRQGRETHVVREGGQIAGMDVLAIRGGKVVLGNGRRKQVLLLYGP